MNAISITFPRRWPWCAALLLMALSCKGSETAAPPTTGSIRVTAATGGTDLDPDGYTVALQGDTLSGTGSSSQPIAVNGTRSEERRVGKECRCRGWPGHEKKEQRQDRDNRVK